MGFRFLKNCLYSRWRKVIITSLNGDQEPLSTKTFCYTNPGTSGL